MRVCSTVTLTVIIAIASACGSDSTAPAASSQPQPPAGSATQVPRVLGLSTIDGNRLPAMHYTSPTYKSDAWTDSGNATLQGDSMLVLRTYTRWVDHGAGSQAPGTPGVFTTAGRLRATGIAILPYTDGTADTAHVLANGAIEAQLSINENGTPRPFGTFLFAAPYSGGVMNPIPYVQTMQPGSLPELTDSGLVTLTGSSFLPTTQLWWDKVTPLKVTFVGPYELTTVIPTMSLTTPGKHTLTVTNPGPGGGDRILSFEVTIPEPAIISIAPSTMPVGGGDFTLHVHGRNITGATQVVWNGAPRTATWVSPTQVDLYVTNASLQAAGQVTVAVQTLPQVAGTTGGGQSGVVYFTVAPSSAQKLSELAIPFEASVLLADPTRSLLYAFAGPVESTRPHQLVAFDPTTGQAVWSYDTGTQISTAAISDDGQYLYYASADSVIRFSLANRAVDAGFRPGGSPGSSVAIGLAVAPGHPQRIAVLERANANGGISLHAFDGSQELGTGINGAQPLTLGFAGPQTLIAAAPAGAPGSVITYSLTASGLTQLGQQQAGLGDGCCVIGGSRVYTRSGHIYDTSTLVSADIPGFVTANGIVPSSDGTQLYSMTDESGFVRAYDTQTLTETGAVPFNTQSEIGGTSTMVRWGPDGVAFVRHVLIQIVRASFVK